MSFESASSSALLIEKGNEEYHAEQALNIPQDIMAPPVQPQTVPLRKRRNPSESQDSDVEIVALSPTTLMSKNRFVCEVCYKGFPREQNLQLHKRGHNLPWTLKLKTTKKDVKRKMYLCPEPTCLNHNPSHALRDLTGVKKHYSRKHCEKKYKCQKCEKMYALVSDLKAHLKICGVKEYQCHCGTIFSRRDAFTMHKLFCEPLVEGAEVRQPPGARVTGLSSLTSSSQNNHPIHPCLLQLSSQVPFTQNMTSDYITIPAGSMAQFSTTGLLQKAASVGSTSSNNTAINFMHGYASSSSNNVLGGAGSPIFTCYAGATSEQEDIIHGALGQVHNRYNDMMEAYNLKQQQQQHIGGNMGFQQLNGVMMTRDLMGMGEELDMINARKYGPQKALMEDEFFYMK